MTSLQVYRMKSEQSLKDVWLDLFVKVTLGVVMLVKYVDEVCL